ncbi:MAG TPA: trypsin-like peptidase domain-containing protein, partial [Nitrososphaerales archaeon]|nr:trypsin-like peptidase domain-containing protein [Nitrososphaerales archaeon]
MTGTEGSQLLQSFSDAVTELADSVSPSVVSVSEGRRSGTGIVWSSDGLIVTANHVAGRSAAPTVMTSDGRVLAARVVGKDPYADVALLKVDAVGLPPIQQGSGDGIK